MCQTIPIQVSYATAKNGIIKCTVVTPPPAPLHHLQKLQVVEDDTVNCAYSTGPINGNSATIYVTAAQYNQLLALVSPILEPGIVIEVEVDIDVNACCNFLSTTTALGHAIAEIRDAAVESVKQISILNHVAKQLLAAIRHAPPEASLISLTKIVSYQEAEESYEASRQSVGREARISDVAPRSKTG